MEESFEKPRRRPRYAGRNPRSFQDKYKEHQPEKYPEDIRKIVEGGKTPAGMHRPIMVDEVMHVLLLAPGETAVDCTLGYGGHASAMLKAIQPGGLFLGVDADPIELPKTEARLRSLVTPDASIQLRRMNFAGVSTFLATEAPEGVDAVLVDLGCSSMQLDDPTRGFSFKYDGPLDMRMNPNRGLTASELLTSLNPMELEAILVENSDEPHAKRIATAILRMQQKGKIESTLALANIVRQQMRELEAEELDRTVRRVFQSLRIAVNEELPSLDAFLSQIPYLLKKGGRIAMISFHSGEDRRVKAAFKAGFESGCYSSISKEIIRPTFEEQQSNPRSKSAKLRFAIRSDTGL
jgi:16S rRNA (cytosine1402-N4)-methyltransferase